MANKKAQVKKSNTVKVQYTGKLEDGSIVQSTTKGNPLQFTIGAGEVIKGFEQAVVGMEPGQKKTVKVSADEAYGPHRENLVLEIERERIPNDIEVNVGKRLKIQQKDGESTILRVTDFSNSKVTLDANHPLAGKNLIFDIKLIDIA
jgi:FKBP-type peptidyl-prolyl cis-trans isomerase 2